MLRTTKHIIWLLPVLTLLVVILCFISRGETDMTQNSREEVKKENRLINEKSPYLLQHAYNPVDWYPWGEEAFEKARKENKPIFLSIGYSTCHWCHVMEHESFEDLSVAKLMNETFVCIKVDREERPDIDGIYMTVCQLMTGGGGWPLTIIMTPDKKPFFAGTYIPKESKYGRLGMMELIPKVLDLWANEKERTLNTADQITRALHQMEIDIKVEDIDKEVLKSAYSQLSGRFDYQYGGFGNSPKFPTPHNMLFLLRYWNKYDEPQALDMVETTLKYMRLGGVYDQVGFGFHRYSTDSRWFLPHFEKMLYDQAMISMVLTETFQATRKNIYRDTASEIFTYVLRDMTSPEGGFYSAEDADSEGEEGKFYVWTKDELIEVLGEEDGEFIAKVFNVEKNGNFLDEGSGKKTGASILFLKKSLTELAIEMKMSEKDLKDKIEKSRIKLFDHRENRIHPYKDDKILTDWNGLMIASFAKGGRVFNEPDYINSAEKAVAFILDKLLDEDNRLVHRYRDNEAGIKGNVDDYAYFIWGLLELYESTFNVEYLKKAIELNEIFIEHFWDRQKGGFYFTPDDGEELLVRQKEIYDGARPSGNSVAMFNLLKIARITGNGDLEEKAWAIAKYFATDVKKLPLAHTQLMVAIDFASGPSSEVVILGDSDGKGADDILKTLNSVFCPDKVVLLIKAEEKDEFALISPYTEKLTLLDNKATIYVCKDFTCSLPTTDKNKMLELLEN